MNQLEIPSAEDCHSFSDSLLLSTVTEGVNYEEIDAKDPSTLTEVEKIALLGRPKLGDVTKVQIRIKESKEFKVSGI